MADLLQATIPATAREVNGAGACLVAPTGAKLQQRPSRKLAAAVPASGHDMYSDAYDAVVRCRYLIRQLKKPLFELLVPADPASSDGARCWR